MTTAQAAPGPTAPTESAAFTSRDGTELYGEWFAADEPIGAALIMHGYHEHCGRYREVANVLGRAKVSALSFDFRGHGRSQGQRGYIERIRDYLDDLDAALAALEARAGGVPIALVAHSNGALIALRALADPFRAPRRVVAAALSSPFLGLKLEVPRAKVLVGQLAGRWLPRLALPNALRVDMLTTDPQKQNERQLDTLCHDAASARWFTETSDAQQYVVDFARRITIPTFWLVAAGDRIADPGVSRAVWSKIRQNATYHSLDGFEHEVFNERDRQVPFGLLTEFLEASFGD